MTDAELDRLEKRVSGPVKSPWRKEMYYEAVILELIAELRQAKAERNALINYIVEHGGCPISIWDKCPAEQDDPISCKDCWLKSAAKEATCQK